MVSPSDSIIVSLKNSIVTKINTLVGNHNSSNTAHSDIRNSIPSKTSDLTNDSGYLTSHQDYNIKISCKDENDNASYNIDIDTDVTITATVLDFNGEPVIGKSLTIYYDDETSIYTRTTDSNGQISTTYTCTEWGIHTFSVETFSTSINVTGQKKVKEGSNWSGVTYTLYVDEANRSATLVCNISNKDIASGVSNYEMTGWIPSQYRPHSQKFIKGYRGNNNVFYIFYDGRVGVSNLTSSVQTGVTLGAQIDWNF